MSTESTHHLDLEDLLAAIDGKLRDDKAKAHLGSCADCRIDAERWRAVGLGVRHLVAEVASPATPVSDQARLSSPGPAGPFVPATETGQVGRHRRRRVLAGITAAAVLVVAGGSYGLTEALGSGGARAAPPNTPTAAAGLSAVSGCPNLAGVSGTLEQRNGSDLVIETSGRSVTITTSPSTRMIGSEGIGTLGDITDGAQVTVDGTDTHGTITATTVTVGATDKVKPFEPPQPSGPPLTVGTVTDAYTGGFTVVDPDGTSVAVTTTSSTTVITLRTLTVQQLRIGGFTVIVGNTPGHGGTLVAGAVEQVPHPISFPQGPVPGKDKGAACSPENVVTAALMAAR